MTHVTKYTNSLRTYAIAIVSVHLVALGWLFPDILILIVCPPAMFYLLFLYCELMYTIEVGYRETLLKKIRETDDDITKDILNWELLLHEEHSLFGSSPSDRF